MTTPNTPAGYLQFFTIYPDGLERFTNSAADLGASIESREFNAEFGFYRIALRWPHQAPPEAPTADCPLEATQRTERPHTTKPGPGI